MRQIVLGILVVSCISLASMRAEIDGLTAAAVLWAVLIAVLASLAVYRLTFVTRSGAPAQTKRLHRLDVIGASGTGFAGVFLIVLILLFADAMISDIVTKFARILSFR